MADRALALFTTPHHTVEQRIHGLASRPRLSHLRASRSPICRGRRWCPWAAGARQQPRAPRARSRVRGTLRPLRLDCAAPTNHDHRNRSAKQVSALRPVVRSRPRRAVRRHVLRCTHNAPGHGACCLVAPTSQLHPSSRKAARARHLSTSVIKRQLPPAQPHRRQPPALA